LYPSVINELIYFQDIYILQFPQFINFQKKSKSYRHILRIFYHNSTFLLHYVT